MFLVFSTSLNPDSRSRIMARFAAEKLSEHNVECQLVDLAETPLPACDGAACYGDENVQHVSRLVREASGILIAAPIYNYDVGAAAKNLIELTGKAWTEKTVGFLCAAGGQGSYMSVMGLANSLMLDFRSLILPRFVYASGGDFNGDSISETDVENRISILTNDLVRISTALKQ